jgi:hypothetical protein
MRAIIILLLITSLISAQDKSLDGKIVEQNQTKTLFSLNGNSCNCDVLRQSLVPLDKIIKTRLKDVVTLGFSLFWTSPAGAFSNCNDGWVGYLDNDTLLDIVGYTFNPNKLYIWEQVPTNPDSFALIFTYTKQEFGGFGPIAVGDIDGDGKMDIAVADYSTLSRIYIISNTGDNTYVSRETQNTLIHPADGTQAASLLIGDLNKNGQKEIIINRGSSFPTSGSVRIWEHTGGSGSFTFNNLYTYTTSSYLFGKSGIGDSDGDGWDEVFLTYGGYDVFNTNIRKIKYDSVSGTFVHQLFSANAIGFPSSYKVADIYNNGNKELIATQSSNNKAAIYIYKSTGPNQYQTMDSIFEPSDPNTMMISDIKKLTRDTYPTILAASFASNIYMYQYNGSTFVRQYQNNTGLGPATFRVYWLPWTGHDGYFHTWTSSSSNGNFYLYKRTDVNGIENQNSILSSFKLDQNYPNPFNPSTVINYELPNEGNVSLAVYDLNGKVVKDILSGHETKGNHRAEFTGNNLASGIYFYMLKFGENVQTRKMILIK